MSKARRCLFDLGILLIFGVVHFYTWSIRKGLTHYMPIREMTLSDSISELSRLGIKMFLGNLRDEVLILFVGILVISSIFAFVGQRSKLVRYGIVGICCCSVLLHFSILLV